MTLSHLLFRYESCCIISHIIKSVNVLILSSCASGHQLDFLRLLWWHHHPPRLLWQAGFGQAKSKTGGRGGFPARTCAGMPSEREARVDRGGSPANTGPPPITRINTTMDQVLCASQSVDDVTLFSLGIRAPIFWTPASPISPKSPKGEAL